MEQKKELTWEERHPFGNLRYYTYLDSFEGAETLGETTAKCALRVLKSQLENKIGFELTDKQFIAIFNKVIILGPARPLGAYSFLYGFVKPMQKLLAEQNLHCGINELFSFFNVRNYDDRRYWNIILHVPHSSSEFPEESKYSWNDLDDEERLLIDYYTDELFVPQQKTEQISSLVFPYCRLYCDVERLINDPLEKRGLGISYSRWVNVGKYRQTIRSFSSLISVYKLYSDFHADASLSIMESNGTPLLIDCHSFSNKPNLLCSNPPDIDICVGYNDDETCPNKVTIGNIIQYFRSKGYKVGVNTPFSNSKTFSAPKEYHSVMIEVNKRLYMDELTFMKYDNFDKLKHDLQSLYTIILK